MLHDVIEKEQSRPEVMQQGVESQSVSPARGEVGDQHSLVPVNTAVIIVIVIAVIVINSSITTITTIVKMGAVGVRTKMAM